MPAGSLVVKISLPALRKSAAGAGVAIARRVGIGAGVGWASGGGAVVGVLGAGRGSTIVVGGAGVEWAGWRANQYPASASGRVSAAPTSKRRRVRFSPRGAPSATAGLLSRAGSEFAHGRDLRCRFDRTRSRGTYPRDRVIHGLALPHQPAGEQRAGAAQPRRAVNGDWPIGRERLVNRHDASIQLRLGGRRKVRYRQMHFRQAIEAELRPVNGRAGGD